jgi:hypothetical protein
MLDDLIGHMRTVEVTGVDVIHASAVASRGSATAASTL